jgi:hypothetical protein
MKTIFMVATIFAVGALVSYALPTQVFAYDGGDESETNTQQVLKQKNVGSGESTNFNCGENNIEATVPIQACGTLALELGGDGGTLPPTGPG